MNFSRKAVELVEGGEIIETLESPEEIEDVIFAMHELNERKDFYKRLKKKRIAQIDEEVKRIDARQKQMKDLVLATLKACDKKSLNFPGVGKAVSTTKQGVWTILDQDKLIAEIKKNLETKDFEKIVESRPNIVKKNLNKYLDMLKKSGEVPASVKKEDSSTSCTITVDKKIDAIYEEDIPQVVSNSQPQNDNELNGLEV